MTLNMTLIGGPTVLIEAAGFRLVTDPTLDAPGEYHSSYVTLTKTSGPAALGLQSRLQMLEPGVATTIGIGAATPAPWTRPMNVTSA